MQPNQYGINPYPPMMNNINNIHSMNMNQIPPNNYIPQNYYMNNFPMNHQIRIPPTNMNMNPQMKKNSYNQNYNNNNNLVTNNNQSKLFFNFL